MKVLKNGIRNAFSYTVHGDALHKAVNVATLPQNVLMAVGLEFYVRSMFKQAGMDPEVASTIARVVFSHGQTFGARATLRSFFEEVPERKFAAKDVVRVLAHNHPEIFEYMSETYLENLLNKTFNRAADKPNPFKIEIDFPDFDTSAHCV